MTTIKDILHDFSHEVINIKQEYEDGEINEDDYRDMQAELLDGYAERINARVAN